MKILILCLFLGLTFSCSRDGGDGSSSEKNPSSSDPSTTDDGEPSGDGSGDGDGDGNGNGNGDDTSDLPIKTILQFGASSAPKSTVPMGGVMSINAGRLLVTPLRFTVQVKQRGIFLILTTVIRIQRSLKFQRTPERFNGLFS